MPSLRSHILISFIRNRHLLKLSLKRDTWDMNTSIAQFRAECEAGAKKAGKLPDGIEVLPAKIDGLPAGLSAEWILPCDKASPAERVMKACQEGILFYTLGGGYVSGSCSDHRHFVAKIVNNSGVAALLFEYRLAPEHPFPAAIQDSLTAYRWLLNQGISSHRIVMVGESAGGGLCLATLLALRDQGTALPAAAVALSPWTDLKLTGDSYRTKVDVCISPINMNAVCSKYYVGENDPCSPWISPLYGDLHGLPPISIYVGEDETMLDDSVRFAERAKAAGVDVRLKVERGMVHCYPLFAPLFPEATQAINELSEFIKVHLDRTRTL